MKMAFKNIEHYGFAFSVLALALYIIGVMSIHVFSYLFFASVSVIVLPILVRMAVLIFRR
jgi:hypothetical protein